MKHLKKFYLSLQYISFGVLVSFLRLLDDFVSVYLVYIKCITGSLINQVLYDRNSAHSICYHYHLWHHTIILLLDGSSMVS